jgi:hypothetical protein
MHAPKFLGGNTRIMRKQPPPVSERIVPQHAYVRFQFTMKKSSLIINVVQLFLEGFSYHHSNQIENERQQDNISIFFVGWFGLNDCFVELNEALPSIRSFLEIPVRCRYNVL